jgi:Na+/H+-translocating membrane pyrophosphatase
MYYPVFISAFGIIACIATSFFATDFITVEKEKQIETTLKM